MFRTPSENGNGWWAGDSLNPLESGQCSEHFTIRKENLIWISLNPLESGQCSELTETGIIKQSRLKMSQSPRIGAMFRTRYIILNDFLYNTSQSPRIGAMFRTDLTGKKPTAKPIVSIPSNRGNVPNYSIQDAQKPQIFCLNPLESGQCSEHKSATVTCTDLNGLNPLESGQCSEQYFQDRLCQVKDFVSIPSNRGNVPNPYIFLPRNGAHQVSIPSNRGNVPNAQDWIEFLIEENKSQSPRIGAMFRTRIYK